jgi:phosphoketolase
MNANDIALTQVDKLGLLLAQIAELTAQADAIKDSIKDAATAGGEKVVEGNLFKATVVEANRKVTDWKAIAKVCNIPEDVIIENTKVTAVFSVKTTAR